MKKGRYIVGALLAAAFIFGGCVTKLENLTADDQLHSGAGYIAGKFFDPNSYFLRLSRKSPYALELADLDTNSKYSFQLGRDEGYDIYPLPVGNYRVNSISKTESTPSTDESSVGGTVHIILKLPEELQIDFKVEESMVTYIGDIVLNPKKILIFFKVDQVDFVYDYDKAKQAIVQQYGNVTEDDFKSIYD